jgi:CBS domain-containing protein
MQVRDFMTPNVETLRPDDTLLEAALKMRDLEIRLLPVSSGDHIVGVVTESDMVERAIVRGPDAPSTPVSEVMTAEVVCCFEEDDAEEAARLMQERRVRRLIVFDRKLRLSGVVSLGDLARRRLPCQTGSQAVRDPVAHVRTSLND